MSKHYQVTAMVTRVIPAKGGGFSEVIEVRFTSEAGASGAIQLAKGEFDKLPHEQAIAMVASRLEAEAKKLDAILKL